MKVESAWGMFKFENPSAGPAVDPAEGRRVIRREHGRGSHRREGKGGARRGGGRTGGRRNGPLGLFRAFGALGGVGIGRTPIQIVTDLLAGLFGAS